MSGVECPVWVRFRELISGVVGGMTREEMWQVAVLFQGGCTVADVEFAVDRWGQARHVGDDWAWLRATILHRAGERLALTEKVRREAGV